MSIWILAMFLMGLFALICDTFNIYAGLTTWWAIGLMVLAFFMLTHVWQREKEGEKEKLAERIQELESVLKSQ